MGILDIFILVIAIVAVLGTGFYFFTRWAGKKVADQQQMMQSMNQSMTIYVIDKKRDKITNANFGAMQKMIEEQMPKRAKLMKMYLVKVKTGPQIVTMLADKHVFNALPLKKNVRVDVSGIYITNMQGLKSKKEMKEAAKKKGK